MRGGRSGRGVGTKLVDSITGMELAHNWHRTDQPVHSVHVYGVHHHNDSQESTAITTPEKEPVCEENRDINSDI